MTKLDRTGWKRKIIERKGVGPKWNIQALEEIQEAVLDGYRIIHTGYREDLPCFNYQGNKVRVVLYKTASEAPVSSAEPSKEGSKADVVEKEEQALESVTEAPETPTEAPKRRGRPPKSAD